MMAHSPTPWKEAGSPSCGGCGRLLLWAASLFPDWGGTVWVLLAVLVVVAGFALRINAMLVVTVAGIVAAAIAGLSPLEVLNAFGEGFAGSRSVTVFIVTLPVIGLIERYGLQHQARKLISKLKVLTTGRLLAIYLLIRQGTAALGLTSIGGPRQAGRPLGQPHAAR